MSMANWWCFGCGALVGSYDEQHVHRPKKENKMNNQMEQVWRSKDGKCVGSQAEVEAYLSTLSPLGKMQFPYASGTELVYGGGQSIMGKELASVVAFANLAPLYPAMFDEMKSDWHFWSPDHNAASEKFYLAYEEALKLVPR